MMPPDESVEPATGDVVPYPNDLLILGGNRWLAITGRILPTPFGDEVELTPQTLAFWEAAALRGQGKPLSELIV
ncbi:hypothetical protein SEA_CHARM_3 [Mycobacterium phage Charm]|nr:hypothetical protein SEA_CHARM_3 [Mycobacterium phage Charm]